MVAARARFAGTLCAAAFLCGCGSGGHSSARTSTSAAKARASHAAQRAAPADPAAVRVIKAWSSALRRGDVRRAARYFAIPSVMVNGVGGGGQLAVITIRTAAEALLANETLPCGARFVSAEMRGRYVNVLFALTARPGPGGSDCGTGRGALARTVFVVAAGRITEWIRVPLKPGVTPPAPPPPAQPSTPQPTGASPVA